jgi:hypothetical protein
MNDVQRLHDALVAGPLDAPTWRLHAYTFEEADGLSSPGRCGRLPVWGPGCPPCEVRPPREPNLDQPQPRSTEYALALDLAPWQRFLK